MRGDRGGRRGWRADTTNYPNSKNIKSLIIIEINLSLVLLYFLGQDNQDKTKLHLYSCRYTTAYEEHTYIYILVNT